MQLDHISVGPRLQPLMDARVSVVQEAIHIPITAPVLMHIRN